MGNRRLTTTPGHRADVWAFRRPDGGDRHPTWACDFAPRAHRPMWVEPAPRPWMAGGTRRLAPRLPRAAATCAGLTSAQVAADVLGSTDPDSVAQVAELRRQVAAVDPRTLYAVREAAVSSWRRTITRGVLRRVSRVVAALAGDSLLPSTKDDAAEAVATRWVARLYAAHPQYRDADGWLAAALVA